MRLSFLIFIIFLLTGAYSLNADQRQKKQRELDQLESHIQKLRKTIQIKENSKSRYLTELRKIEQNIGNLSGEIRQSKQDLRSKQKQLETLESTKKSIQQDIRQHNNMLSKELYAAYTLGDKDQMKLLFSQQKADHLQRNLTYYRYFNQFRLNLIHQAQSNFRRLDENQKQIQTASQQLQILLQQQQQQKQKLSEELNHRETILGRLDEDLKKQGGRLTRLEEDARELTALIESLSDILADIPPPEVNRKQFADLRGKLAWPVKGQVKKMFGHLKPLSNMRWHGVIIRAPMGNNVRAVSHGRVAFSDWLRGMGNLMLIDHGDGYLSLYGHNQSLFKTTGDWVEAGEIIASIGNSGGQKKPGLYFEIRKQGRPQNPTKWCKTSNWFAT